jgi:hypothetical protein
MPPTTLDRAAAIDLSGITFTSLTVGQFQKRIAAAIDAALAEADAPPCQHCGTPICDRRCDARFCSTPCRQAAWRASRDDSAS